MSTFIVFLRGINVSGKNIIKMVDLRVLLDNLKFKNVQTYIQSGNIILDSFDDSLAIENKIHQAISEKFGYDINVLALKRAELVEIFNNNPFINSCDIVKLCVTLLNIPPDLEYIDYLKERAAQNEDEFIIKDKCVYIHCPNGYGRTKITNSVFEKKLGSPATSRNWKTITKMVELSKI